MLYNSKQSVVTKIIAQITMIKKSCRSPVHIVLDPTAHGNSQFDAIAGQDAENWFT